jgi:hypothetical protein
MDFESRCIETIKNQITESKIDFNNVSVEYLQDTLPSMIFRKQMIRKAIDQLNSQAKLATDVKPGILSFSQVVAKSAGVTLEPLQPVTYAEALVYCKQFFDDNGIHRDDYADDIQEMNDMYFRKKVIKHALSSYRKQYRN